MNSITKKYASRFTAFGLAYLAFNIAAITGAFEGARSPATWGLAFVVSAPVLGLIWTHLSWLRESDEFIRAVHAKRFIVATGIALAISSAWGFLEIYAGTTHISPALILPLIYSFYFLTTPFIRTSH